VDPGFPNGKGGAKVYNELGQVKHDLFIRGIWEHPPKIFEKLVY